MALRGINLIHFRKYLYFLNMIINKLRQTVISRLPTQANLKEILNIFTNKHLLMVASSIMPGNSIIIDIIEHSQASFCRPVDLLFCIIWLWNISPSKLGLVASVGPGLERPERRGRVGRSNPNTGPGPEPSSYIDWLEILTVTSVEVAKTTRGPCIWDVS